MFLFLVPRPHRTKKSTHVTFQYGGGGGPSITSENKLRNVWTLIIFSKRCKDFANNFLPTKLQAASYCKSFHYLERNQGRWNRDYQQEDAENVLLTWVFGVNSVLCLVASIKAPIVCWAWVVSVKSTSVNLLISSERIWKKKYTCWIRSKRIICWPGERILIRYLSTQGLFQLNFGQKAKLNARRNIKPNRQGNTISRGEKKGLLKVCPPSVCKVRGTLTLGVTFQPNQWKPIFPLAWYPSNAFSLIFLSCYWWAHVHRVYNSAHWLSR